MTEPVKCAECDGRGWKIVTRRGCIAAASMYMEQSAQEDCLFCEGQRQLVEMFEWEVFVTSEGTDQLGPCGISSGQATAMDTLRTTLARMSSNAAVWGRITHRIYDFGTMPDDWSRRVIFRAAVDPAGSVRFERVAS